MTGAAIAPTISAMAVSRSMPAISRYVNCFSSMAPVAASCDWLLFGALCIMRGIVFAIAVSPIILVSHLEALVQLVPLKDTRERNVCWELSVATPYDTMFDFVLLPT